MSVKYWKLPSWADARKALTVLSDAAERGGVAPILRERALQLKDTRTEYVELPGFHLFEHAYPDAPYTWLVPKPRGDFQDIVGMWEAYVGQGRLGARSATGSPLTPISGDRTVLGPVTFRRFFGGPRRLAEWYTPAAKIIAMAQHLEGQEHLRVDPIRLNSRFERSRLPTLSLHLADYYLEVSDEHIYSNTLQEYVRPIRPPGDATIDELSIRPLKTAHPLAVAMMECEETPPTCLHAMNVALRGAHAGHIRPAEVRLGASKSFRPDRNAAVLEAFKALDIYGSLRAVYDQLVPAVMQAADFRKEFGNPFRQSAPRPDTVERWRMALFSLAT